MESEFSSGLLNTSKPLMGQSILKVGSLGRVLDEETSDKILSSIRDLVPAGKVKDEGIMESHSDSLLLVFMIKR